MNLLSQNITNIILKTGMKIVPLIKYMFRETDCNAYLKSTKNAKFLVETNFYSHFISHYIFQT